MQPPRVVCIAVVFATVACGVDLRLPAGAVVTCEQGACPSGYYCQQTTVVCIPDDGLAGNVAPIIQAFTVDDDPVRGLSILRVIIADTGAELARFASLELAFDAAFTTAIEVPLEGGVGRSFPSGALTELATSRAGESHSVTWDSRVAAPVAVDTAYLRLRVADVYDAISEPAVAGPFRIGNRSAPRAELVYIKSDGSASAGVVPIAYGLVDEDGDMADVLFEFSLGGNLWRPCTEYPTPASEGQLDLATAPSRQGGMLHAFYWDTGSDAYTSATALLRVTAADDTVGVPTLVEAALEVGFPNDPRQRLTALGDANEANEARWLFADLNGDGIADGIAAASYPGLFVGLTSPGESPTMVYSSGSMSPITGTGVLTALGDLDGDGDVDIVYTNPEDVMGPLVARLNDGAGLFNTSVQANLGLDGAPIAGDFDGDGRAEVLVARGPEVVRVQLSGASWSLLVTNLTGAPLASVAIGGRDQLVLRTTSLGLYAALPGTAMFLPRDTPAIEACVAPPVAADIDGSGVDDLVCAAPEVVLGWFDPEGAAGPAVVLADGRFGELTVGDVDGDARDDLLAQSASRRSVVVLRSRVTPDGSVTLLEGAPLFIRNDDFVTGMVLTDLDGDGRDDVFAGGLGSLNYVLRDALVPITALVGPQRDLGTLAGAARSVAAADVDRDGVVDLVFAHGEPSEPAGFGGLEVVTMGTVAGVPTGQPRANKVFRGDLAMAGIALGDFDGDGLLDAASVSLAESTLLVFYGALTSEGSSFSEPRLYDLPGDNLGSNDLIVRPVAACNLDGDPRLELVMVAYLDSADRYPVLIGDVDTSRELNLRQVLDIDSVRTSITCADLNADGRRDIVTTGYFNNGGPLDDEDVFFADAAGDFYPVARLNAGARPIVSDLDRNGAPDLIAVNRTIAVNVSRYTAGTSSPGVGSGNFSLVELPGFSAPLLNSLESVVAVDLDGNSLPDIVYVGSAAPPGMIARADASALATALSSLGVATGLVDSVLTDIDGDDVVDLIATQPRRQTAFVQPFRRPATPWVYTGAASDPIRRLVPPSARTDRFGLTRNDPLILRPFLAARDGRAPWTLASQEELGDLAAAVRDSGVQPVPRGLVPITEAWTALGDLRLTRVLDPLSGVGTRLRVERRTDDRRLVVRLPYLPGKSASAVRVFFEAVDWRRASESVVGSDGPWPGEDTYLPRDVASGKDLLLLAHHLVELPRDADGDLATGEGPRFVVNLTDGTIDGVIEGGGTIQAFNAY